MPRRRGRRSATARTRSWQRTSGSHRPASSGGAASRTTFSIVGVVQSVAPGGEGNLNVMGPAGVQSVQVGTGGVVPPSFAGVTGCAASPQPAQLASASAGITKKAKRARMGFDRIIPLPCDTCTRCCACVTWTPRSTSSSPSSACELRRKDNETGASRSPSCGSGAGGDPRARSS